MFGYSWFLAATYDLHALASGSHARAHGWCAVTLGLLAATCDLHVIALVYLQALVVDPQLLMVYVWLPTVNMQLHMVYLQLLMNTLYVACNLSADCVWTNGHCE